MSFSTEEREYLAQVIRPVVREESDFKRLFEETVFDFIKAKNRFSTLQDRIFYLKRNKYRPYDILTLTKLLTPEVEPFRIIEDTVSELTLTLLKLAF